MFKANCRLSHRLSLAAALCALSVPALAAKREADESKKQAPVLLVVQKLRDAGGLPAPEKGQQPINDSLTTGIVHYLADHKQNFAVWDGRTREPAERPAGQHRLSVEGDLSRMAGETGNKDIYLLTVRLFEEGTTRHILAQWSGSARSLLYLSNNTHHDPRFSIDGLLGEMGGRIVQTTQAFASPSRDEQQKKLEQMLTRLKPAGDEFKARTLTADLKADEKADEKKDEKKEEKKDETKEDTIDKKEGGAALTLVAGEAYHLSLRSRADAEIYVLSRQDSGIFQSLLVPAEGKVLEVKRDQPLLLPAEGTWHAPEAAQAKTLELILLERPMPITKQESIQFVAPATAPPVQGAEKERPADDAAPKGLGLEGEPDVQVLSGGNRLLPRNSGDTTLDRVMKSVQSGNQDNWRVVRLKITILSKAAKSIRKVAMLGVGIDHYPHIPKADLEFARRDAQQTGTFWTGLGAQTQLLLNENATRASILQAWTTLLTNAQPTDLVILHWSGHSGHDKETTLLIPADAEANPRQTAITLDEFVAPILQTKAGAVLLVFDVNAINVADLKRDLIDALTKSKSTTSVGILAGKGEGYEDTDLKSGILTYGMLKSLQKQSVSNRSCTFLPLSEEAIKAINSKDKAAKVQPTKILYGDDFPIFPDYMTLKK